MKLAREICWLVVIFVAILTVGRTAHGQTTWGYVPTNAFTSLVFSNPTCLISPPGETNRLFIVEKHGRIIVITNLANPTRTIFMDLSGKVRVGSYSEATDASGEEGLLGMAFHPGYATNRFFYIFYTDTNGTARDDVLSRFQTTLTNDNVALTNSEICYLVQYDRAPNHNAGDLHFGSDGYLYVALGDEGGGYDQFANSQRIDKNYFSAIMRIDVDKKPANLPPNPHASLPALTNYFVPADNPWVGATNFNNLAVNATNVRTEFWAVGMRNPWRFSFDPVTGELYLGHVGQDAIEWVDIVTNGANCGWSYYEGDGRPDTGSPPAGFVFLHPLIEYGHTNNRVCIIGGNVCRGTRWPNLNGSYLYADYGSGEVWSLRHTGTNVTQNNIILSTGTGTHIGSFGIDPSNGDPLFAAIRAGNNSIIERIISTNTVPVFNSVKLFGTNLVASGTNGPHNASYFVLTSTNLAPSATNWTRAATNPFDAAGGFSFTNPIAPGRTNLFYMLQLQ